MKWTPTIRLICRASIQQEVIPLSSYYMCIGYSLRVRIISSRGYHDPNAHEQDAPTRRDNYNIVRSIAIFQGTPVVWRILLMSINFGSIFPE